MSNDITTKYELTNQCTCDNEADYTSCYGYCWEDNVNDFYNVNEKFLNSNDTGWWRVTNLGLWDGNHSGYFYVQPTDKPWVEAQNIVAGMTVNSAWIMRYTPYDDRIEYSLSHHDSMGSNTTLTAVSEEEREELGLY
jgi:hypothetical protein